MYDTYVPDDYYDPPTSKCDDCEAVNEALEEQQSLIDDLKSAIRDLWLLMPDYLDNEALEILQSLSQEVYKEIVA